MATQNAGEFRVVSLWLLAIGILLPQIALPLQLFGMNDTTTSLVSSGFAFAAAIGAVLSGRWRAPRGALPAFLILGVVVIVGLAVGLNTLPTVQVLQGLRILLLPVAAAVVGCRINAHQSRTLMRAVSLLMIATALAAAVEVVLGADRLVRAGLVYGTTVRTYSGVLRAPGLALTNYDLGSFTGVFLGIAVLWWLPTERSRRWRTWGVVAVLAATAALYLSTFRTGMVVLVAAVGLWAATRPRLSLGVRLLAFVALSVGLLLVGLSGLLSTGSLSERGDVWNQLLTQGFSILGNGLGSSGAASNSSYAINRIVTDNYYLEIVIQYGILGVLAIFVVLVWALRVTRRSSRATELNAGFVLVGALVACWFTEFWEYSSAMMLVMLASAASYSVYSMHQIPEPSGRATRRRQLGNSIDIPDAIGNF